MARDFLPRQDVQIADQSGRATTPYYVWMQSLERAFGALDVDLAALLEQIEQIKPGQKITINGAQSIIVTNVDGTVTITLDGDNDSPGGNWYYGTNADGVRGFWPVADGVSGGYSITKAVDYGPYDYQGELDTPDELPYPVVVGDAYLINGDLWVGADDGGDDGPGWDNIGPAPTTAVLSLVNDEEFPDPTHYYGTNAAGDKGWHAVSDTMEAATGELTKDVDADGVTTFGLADVADSGAGALLAITRDQYGRVEGTKAATITGTAGQIDVANGDAVAGLPTISLADVADAGGGSIRKFDRDAKGRVSGTSAATTDDLTEGASNLYFTAARVRSTLLTGLSLASSAVISATDSVLSAFGKLQAQITALAASLSGYVPTSRTISTTAPLTGGGNLSANRTLAISAATTSAAGSMSAADKTKLDGIATGATAGATWGTDLASIPANITAWAAIAPSSKADDNAVLKLAGGTMTGGISIGVNDWRIQSTTSPGADTTRIIINSAGSVDSGRGAYLAIHGINHANAGTIQLRPATGYYTVTSGDSFRPFSDSATALGVAAGRWSVVFAATGTINTSDAREKTPVRPMDSQEIAAAQALASEIGTYQWLASIETKGEDARLHVGMTVQRAIEIMDAHDLNPYAYGFICYDQWDERPEIVEDGEIVQPHRPAGDRYSFRMDELCLFLARGHHERLRRIELALGL